MLLCSLFTNLRGIQETWLRTSRHRPSSSKSTQRWKPVPWCVCDGQTAWIHQSHVGTRIWAWGSHGDQPSFGHAFCALLLLAVALLCLLCVLASSGLLIGVPPVPATLTAFTHSLLFLLEPHTHPLPLFLHAYQSSLFYYSSLEDS